MKLTELYTALCSMCGLAYDDKGKLSYYPPNVDQGFPILVKKRPVVFPEQRFMEAIENIDAKFIPLHPLAETVNRGLSDVLRKLTNCAILRMNSLTDYLMRVATEINGNLSSDKSAKYSSAISTLFMDVGQVDNKFVDFLSDIYAAIGKSASAKTVNFFNVVVRPNYNVNGSTYLAVAIITSPLYMELEAYQDGSKNDIFGVAVPRKRDAKTLKALLLALFPKLGEGVWLEKSNSDEVPRFISFMQILTSFYTRTNELFKILGSEISGYEGGITQNLDWERSDINWRKLRNQVQVDVHNAGPAKEDELDESRVERDERIESKSLKSTENTVSENKVNKMLDDRDPVKTKGNTADVYSSPYDKPLERNSRDDRRYDDRYDDRGRDRRYDDRYDDYDRYDRRRDRNRRNDRCDDRYDDRYAGRNRDDRYYDDHYDDRDRRNDRRDERDDHPSNVPSWMRGGRDRYDDHYRDRNRGYGHRDRRPISRHVGHSRY